MQLLVSVRDRTEALAALAGGAAIIDAKEPAAGPLGAVALEEFRAIVAAIAAARPVSAALGDADTEDAVEARARAFAAAGAAFIKIGFAGTQHASHVQASLAAAIRGAVPARCQVIGVAYADHQRVSAPHPDVVLSAIARVGAHGALLDTADKRGDGLCRLLAPDALRAWVRAVHAAGLIAALAGQLRVEDLAVVERCGADIGGVRGAACDGAREGTIRATTVRALLESLTRGAPAMPLLR
jgi:uncharacterized protein (UPF0264 family)